MKPFNITGKTALVTGANRGIGEAYVRYLLDAGAEKIYACVRNPDYLEQMRSLNPKVIEPILLDVTNAEHIQALAGKISQLDILVNNAGVANGAFCSSDNALEIARQEMEVNFFGPVAITGVLLPLLKKSPEALIVNISSIAGIANFPAIGPYSCTKAAMHSYTQGLRAELAVDGIRVLGVYPGPIDTRMAEGFEMEKPAPAQVAKKNV